jgi:hypothetical protein
MVLIMVDLELHLGDIELKSIIDVGQLGERVKFLVSHIQSP